MAVQTEVVYPSTAAFSGTGQLDLGPYFVPSVNKLLRLELHAKRNVQIVLFGSTSVEENIELYAVQWVPHGGAPANCVTTADGVNWLIRRQAGDQETRFAWSNATADGYASATVVLEGCWAGQLLIGGDIDLYLSMRSPTGAGIGNCNVFGSIRFWWV